MSLAISSYQFSGPYSFTSSLENRSGIYIILTYSQTSGRYVILDVGESSQVHDRVENHDRKSCWSRHAVNNNIYYAVLYTPNLQQSERQYIEQEIRRQYNPSCGNR